MKDTTGKRLQKYAAIMGMNQSELREKLDFSKEIENAIANFRVTLSVNKN